MSAYDDLMAFIAGSTNIGGDGHIHIEAADRTHFLALVEKVKTDAHNEGRRDGYTQAHTNHAQQPPRNPPTP